MKVGIKTEFPTSLKGEQKKPAQNVQNGFQTLLMDAGLTSSRKALEGTNQSLNKLNAKKTPEQDESLNIANALISLLKKAGILPNAGLAPDNKENGSLMQLQGNGRINILSNSEQQLFKSIEGIAEEINSGSKSRKKDKESDIGSGDLLPAVSLLMETFLQAIEKSGDGASTGIRNGNADTLKNSLSKMLSSLPENEKNILSNIGLNAGKPALDLSSLNNFLNPKSPGGNSVDVLNKIAALVINEAKAKNKQAVNTNVQAAGVSPNRKALNSIMPRAVENKGSFNNIFLTKQPAANTVLPSSTQANLLKGSPNFEWNNIAGAERVRTQPQSPQTLENNAANSKKSIADGITLNGSPGNALNMMSKIEQLVLHVGKNGEVENPQQFMKDFSSILQSFQYNKGDDQSKLFIKLNPGNLGEIRIELTEQNGVMTAKMVTSSSTVKDLLDSQLNQLKTAFIQQNIRVDKMDIVYQQPESQSFEQSQKQEQHPSGQENHSEQQDKGKSIEDEEDFLETLKASLLET